MRNGDILFDNKGDINPQSNLVKSKDVVLQNTDACHIQSFEVTNAIFKKQNIYLTKEEAEKLILAIRNDNIQLKSWSGNMRDRALDKEIIS